MRSFYAVAFVVVGCRSLVACGSDSSSNPKHSADAGTGGDSATGSDAGSDVGSDTTDEAAPDPDASTSDASEAGASSPSGESMPASDLPGWKLVFSEDFTTDAELGNFPGSAYAASFSAYPDGWHDTSGNGQYSPGKTLSVKQGVLNVLVHTENGVHYVSAPEPMLGKGQLYGRYSVRFRATQTTSDYKTAWLLWPDSEKWPDDGEIDFPEGNLDSTISAFAHYANPSGGQDAFPSNAKYDVWHTATTEWSPGNVTFFLDGQSLGSSTTMVPSSSMHYVLQTETNLDGVVPSDSSIGHVEIDWVVIWAKI